MKIHLIIAIAALTVAGTANAQRHSIGVKGGLNVFEMRDGNTTPYYSKPGFHAGVFTHIHLAYGLAIQPELVYSNQGSELKLPLSDQYPRNSVRRVDLNYLNVPVIMQYMFPFGLRLQVGTQFGFLTSAQSEINGEKKDEFDEFRKFDVSAVAGLSYLHRRSGLGVDARYNFGLREINRYELPRTFNQGMQVGMFYQFNH